ncbi:MAG: hypothetical protein HYX92_07515 [Chloroflexi bacterium]|nr:hypothetical protein [Chloroflexota bacterium]
MALGLDPIYSAVLNGTLGNIEVRGLAVTGALGDVLHEMWPEFLAPPERLVPGAWTTVLVTDGASLLAATLTMVATELVFIALGLALAKALWNRREHWSFTAMLVGSVMLQAKGVNGLLALRFSPNELEVMGIAHVFTKLLPTEASAYSSVMENPALSMAVDAASLVLVSLIYGAVAAFWLLRRRPWRGLVLQQGLISAIRDYLCLRARRVAAFRPALFSLVVAVVLFQGIITDAVDYNYLPQSEAIPVAEAQQPTPTATPEATEAVKKAPTPKPKRETKRAAPSKVFIEQGENGFKYTVDGRPESIRGMGYNVKASTLPRSERAARYDRDFAQMKAAGINTVLGWENGEFDELTLGKAQEYGLGVVMPYDLPLTGYDDPDYVDYLVERVSAWVRQHKRFPAVRMWGIGNEVIHGMGGAHTEKAKAFARALVTLADVVHAIDPDHPVIYRDAEDVNFPPISQALQDGVDRPWFIYGANIFTYRMEELIKEWPTKGLNMPLVISEFAPSGLTPEDRPRGYARMWRILRKQKDLVLGGFAYVWCTRGPELVDRVMGLVDDNGRPEDGSLEALSRAFARESVPAPVAPVSE